MFPVVFLSASEAALPNIGSCTFMEYYCDALKCNTLFYKRLQKDPKGDCRFVVIGIIKRFCGKLNIIDWNFRTDDE